MTNNEKIKVEYPGRILREEFMDPYGKTAYRLTKETGQFLQLPPLKSPSFLVYLSGIGLIYSQITI